ncbi:sugar kinase [Paenibacillus woosongensis]|uniref:Sugar kinase n=1 Tax=Paenibacillus woosongensis TaxID=307580 RepID=A0A7X2Z0J1_9BACL|nr:sugar kinase [Paenibacillus woosongensis]MUG45377.1 sugar kinase [Paenibacillus woosongensis]
MNKKLDVVTFGEPMAMFYANDPGELHKALSFSKGMAGAECNVSVGLSRLGHSVGLVTKLGEDNFGRFITDTLNKENIDTSNVKFTNEYRTGMLVKSKVLTGDPVVEYFRKNSAASTISLSDFDGDYFASAKHMHVTGIFPAVSKTCHEFALHAVDFMRSQGKTVSFDPNLRPSLWPDTDTMVKAINDLAARSNWVFPGISEGKLLTGHDKPEDIADFYLARGVSLVVIKLGPDGAYFKSSDGEGYVPGFKVDEVVDTVGAGDGFAVGVISGLLEQLPLQEAVRRGNAIGAINVMSPGDMDGLPDRVKLQKFMEQ